jgi:CRISPR-associated protein Csc2
MTDLTTLQPEFHKELPRLATGKYIHFIVLRHSQSFPVFQTDGVLNTVRTQAGLNEAKDNISRLVMFKRKQTTPERLVGRELLRNLNITTADETQKDKYCAYNGEGSCKKCPDCIIYGFAIGDKGSERSKVYSDSAFSLTSYESSHRSFTFNAPSEGGTMSEGGKMRSSINELDHILPAVTFPAIETLRDTTLEGFVYVLGNLLRTRRYGAQETRTGTMTNHIIGIVMSDGEIFSNLHFTQAIYDAMKDNLELPIDEICQVAAKVAKEQLDREPVRKSKLIFGEDLQKLLAEVNGIYQDDGKIANIMSNLSACTEAYSKAHGALKKDEKKEKKGKKDEKDEQTVLDLDQ